MKIKAKIDFAPVEIEIDTDDEAFEDNFSKLLSDDTEEEREAALNDPAFLHDVIVEMASDDYNGFRDDYVDQSEVDLTITVLDTKEG